MTPTQRYKYLCELFNRAYNDDEVDTPNLVEAGLLRASNGTRTIQFTLTVVDSRAEEPFDFDRYFKKYVTNIPTEEN